MASENHNKKPLVIERRRGKERKKTPRLTKTYEVKIIPATIGVVMETEEPPEKRVAAYCRVSTDQEAQETSLEEQMAHFNTVIAEHSDWELAGIYADEGISGTQVKHRVQFQQMIEDPQSAGRGSGHQCGTLPPGYVSGHCTGGSLPEGRAGRRRGRICSCLPGRPLCGERLL